MKRLVVAFNSRRQDSDSQPIAADVKRRSGFFSRPPSNTPADLHVPPAAYSSSSSDGSVVQTPEPEDELGSATPTRATTRWASWMRPKSNVKAKPHHVTGSRERASTERASTERASTEPRQKRVPVVHPIPTTLDSDDESDHYDDEPPPPPSPPPSRPVHSPATSGRVLQPATLLRSQMNIRAISLSSLIPPLSPPPLLHLPSSPLFPRSSNPARSLPSLQTTRVVLHKTALLRRLESQTLTPSEKESIAAFGHRPKHVVPKTRRRGIDDEALSDVKKLRYYSSGLRVWLDRRCFEERCVLWTWDAERKEVVTLRIQGSERAVASLEFSEGVEALAGYTFEPLPSPHASLPASKSTALLPPLLINSLSPPCEVISAGSSTPSASTGPSTPTTVVPPVSPVTPRKIIRFFPDPDPDPEDEEDNVPLGYQVLTKREAERLIEDRERQAREDERMKKVYAAEVAAARARREGARAGSMHEVEIDKAKDRRERYTRPAYDPAQAIPRRMASEPDARSRPHGSSRVVDDGKSRPPSIGSGWVGPGSSSPGTPPLPSSPLYPRSQSMQSVEDLQEARRRRRMSNFSEGARSTPSRPPSAPSASGRSSTYSRTLPRAHSSGSGMSGMNMMMPVPPLPVHVMPLPVFVMPPASPQFFVPQPMPQMQYQSQTPIAPPNLPMSRSTEGLRPPRSHHSGRPESSSVRPAAPRHLDDDIKRMSRTSVPAPPVSFMQSTPHHASGFRGTRPSSSR